MLDSMMKNDMTFHSQKNTKISRGSMLVYALVITATVGILLSSIIGFVVQNLKFSSNRAAREEAFQVAESGIYSYRWYLAHATDGMNAQQLKAFWQDSGTLGVSGPVEADYTDPGTGNVIGHYSLVLDPPDPSSTIATITSTGTATSDAGVSRTVKARFRRPSWSEYIYLVNDFVNFGSAAEVFGKVHSNTGVRFDGLAHNSVTSLSSSFDDPSISGSALKFGVHTTKPTADPNAPSYPWPAGTVPNRPDVFEGGRQFPVPEVSFTGVSSDLVSMKQEASSGNGHYFDCSGAGRRIILKADGSFDVCTVNAYDLGTLNITNYFGTVTNAIGSYSSTNGNPCVTTASCASSSFTWVSSSNHNRGKCTVNFQNMSIPNDGIIFVEDNAWVEGQVSDRRVTIAAANLVQDATCGSTLANVFLGYHSAANLLYTYYDGRDVIGLVGQKNVQIGRDCPNNTIIDAALLAQDQTGKVFRKSEDYCSANKNNLTINGAIASYLQPYFNSGSCGFSTRTYNFDNNLLYYPPPYFPTGTEYSIDLWEEL